MMTDHPQQPVKPASTQTQAQPQKKPRSPEYNAILGLGALMLALTGFLGTQLYWSRADFNASMARADAERQAYQAQVDAERQAYQAQVDEFHARADADHQAFWAQVDAERRQFQAAMDESRREMGQTKR